MHKPPVEVLDAFCERFRKVSEELGREQYLLPYFMSGHPGCTIKDMIELAEYLRDHHMYTEQVQDFTPTPMTVSTTMYYTGLDPFTQEVCMFQKAGRREYSGPFAVQRPEKLCSGQGGIEGWQGART